MCGSAVLLERNSGSRYYPGQHGAAIRDVEAASERGDFNSPLGQTNNGLRTRIRRLNLQLPHVDRIAVEVAHADRAVIEHQVVVEDGAGGTGREAEIDAILKAHVARKSGGFKLGAFRNEVRVGCEARRANNKCPRGEQNFSLDGPASW